MSEICRKRSKRWCKSGWDVPIWERFEEDENKRVKMLKIKVKSSDVAYVKEAAHRKGISNSCMFEMILDRYFFSTMSDQVLFLPKTICGIKNTPSQYFPKWYIHPAYLELLREHAKKRGHSLVVMMSEILLAYRNKYPKSIRKEYEILF